MDCKKKPEPCRAGTFIDYMNDLGINALFNAESETSATGIDHAVLRGIATARASRRARSTNLATSRPRSSTP